MEKFVVVFVDPGKSYLARWNASDKIYEAIAKGPKDLMQHLANDLNSEGNVANDLNSKGNDLE